MTNNHENPDQGDEVKKRFMERVKQFFRRPVVLKILLALLKALWRIGRIVLGDDESPDSPELPK